ncbi:MAG: hypothetical protein H0U21_10210 [Acidimicrobiia bacterium]|nr:hypothetical protein [Acidimicrobiia bacterium]
MIDQTGCPIAADPIVVVNGRRASWRFSTGYYVVLVVLQIVVHLRLFENAVGISTSRWFSMSNEVYVVALVVPLFWDVVASRRRSVGVEVVTTKTDGMSPVARHIVWYGALLGIMACLEGPLWERVFGRPLPHRIVTVRDVVFGLILVSLYFDWSRGLWRGFRRGATTAPRLVSGWARLLVVLVVLAANIAIFQQPVRDLVGARVFSAVDLHAEGFAVMFFVPVYFDIVVPLTGGDPLRATPGPLLCSARRWAIIALWIAVLTFFVWVGQGAAKSWFDNGFGQWFVRSSETPLAAAVFTIYFELSRRFDGVPNERPLRLRIVMPVGTPAMRDRA